MIRASQSVSSVNGQVFPAPVALFVYNRPWHTRQTIEALLANAEASLTDLHIFCDAAKRGQDNDAVSAVRDYVRQVAGFRSVAIVERDSNFGLARSIIDGVSRVCGAYGRVIVLEDDMVTSPYFLRFMNDGLNLYVDDERVISIAGYTYPVTAVLPETFFLKVADCWGWATWQRGWDLFEPDGRQLLSDLHSQGLTRSFDFDGAYPFTKMLRLQIAGKNNSWAIRWYASAFLRDKLTLYPGCSLVRNIGMDGSGTHCSSATTFAERLTDTPIRVCAVPIVENKAARQSFVDFYRRSRPNLCTKVLRRAAAMLRKRAAP